MPRLTYYLLRQMAVATLMTAAGLTFAIWLSQSLRLLDSIVNRGLSVGLAVEFLLLLLPSLSKPGSCEHPERTHYYGAIENRRPTHRGR